jgi:hypothetical protein
MVSAVSSQTASIDLSSYKADTDNGTQQVGSAQQTDQSKPVQQPPQLPPATRISDFQEACNASSRSSQPSEISSSHPTPNVQQIPSTFTASRQWRSGLL